MPHKTLDERLELLRLKITLKPTSCNRVPFMLPVGWSEELADEVIKEVKETVEAVVGEAREENGKRVSNIIDELRRGNLYDDDLYAHFYRVIKGY